MATREEQLIEGIRQVRHAVLRSLHASMENTRAYTYDYRRGHYAGQRDALLQVKTLVDKHLPLEVNGAASRQQDRSAPGSNA